MSIPNSGEYYPELPTCVRYHPESDLGKLPGYYPNISNDQLRAASEVMSLITKERLNFSTDEEDEFLKLLRFLRARKFHVQHTFKMIKEDILWRNEENRLNLVNESARDVLGCDLGKMYSYFPTWIQGVDKQLRPVSYRQFGKFEVWNVLKLTSMERLIRFHAWETEMALRRMYAQSRRTGYNIETFVLVIDAAGWSMKLATSDAFTFIKGMATTDSDHYPERLGTMVVINAPSVLSFAWRIIQGFLDPVTKSKIRILPADPAQWKPVLLEYIDEYQIPRQYGGMAPDPTGDEALRQMNPPHHTDDDDDDDDAAAAGGEDGADGGELGMNTKSATIDVRGSCSDTNETNSSGGSPSPTSRRSSPLAAHPAVAESRSGAEPPVHAGMSLRAVSIDCGTQTIDPHILNKLAAINADNRQLHCGCAVM